MTESAICILLNRPIRTPALIYDETSLRASCQKVRNLGDSVGAKVLYSLKAFAFADALRLMSPALDGFAVSSLFEANLAKSVTGRNESLHISTPGVRPDEMESIAGLCDYITFNSISQWLRLQSHAEGRIQCGIRINPGLSFIEDERYDPCRKHSKLGVPLIQLRLLSEDGSEVLRGIRGLHFHSNCDSTDLSELLATVRMVEGALSRFLDGIEWINLGGGYIFDDMEDFDSLHIAVDILTSQYNLEVFIEPGAAIVRDAAYLVSTVLDLFDNQGKTIAILDTTVNHIPEAFEYQSQPDVFGHFEGAPHQYVLGGCSCLAGDIFGEYAFEEPLEVGSRIVFPSAGAYTLVKAHTFNGINLPTIYALTENDELKMKKQFTYEDFASRCGVETDVFV